MIDARSGLTESEQLVVNHLSQAWNAFMALRPGNMDDIDDFRRAIHDGQRIIQSRALARQYPRYWIRDGGEPSVLAQEDGR